ncbi:MAG: alpha/beta hydrolase [Alphaproteobacteria bacterium]|nr:alpha/beta hydrolase [Alphaproteobacteria bacterium]
MRGYMKLLLLIGLCLAFVLLALFAWLWTSDKPRPDLEAQYLEQPSDIREVSGVSLHVRDTGPRDGPVVILMHGFGSSLQTWEGWARGLEDRFRVIRFDLPGSGLSMPDPTGDYSDSRTLDLLGALMDQLGVDKAALVGNSIGGRLAWRMAAAHPERVTKLVLVSPDGYASQGFEYGKAPDVPATINLMRYFLPKFLLKQSLVPAYGDPDRLTPDTIQRYYDLMLAPGSREALIHRMEQTVLVDPNPLLAKIEVPVLLVWGVQDAMIPISNAADYQRVLPNSSLLRLDGLGHVPQEEAPEQSLPSVRVFLEQE